MILVYVLGIMMMIVVEELVYKILDFVKVKGMELLIICDSMVGISVVFGFEVEWLVLFKVKKKISYGKFLFFSNVGVYMVWWVFIVWLNLFMIIVFLKSVIILYLF